MYRGEIRKEFIDVSELCTASSIRVEDMITKEQEASILLGA
jgi:hypothetical protein